MTLWDLLATFTTGQVLAVLGAALAAILPGMGSAKAVGSVGESLAGLLSEDPSKFGKAFTLQILPATQGIYGFVVAFMIMLKVGVFGGGIIDSVGEGMYYFVACLPMAIVGYFSAIKQGRVGSAGVAMVAKRPDASGKAITSTALVETYAILALIVSVLFILFSPFGA